MDFSPPKSSSRSATLARQIFFDRVTHSAWLALERSGEWFDTELWRELARAGLTALAIPESHGGGGLGIEELCAVFEEQGRHAAPVPLLATAVLGALPDRRVRHVRAARALAGPVAEQGGGALCGAARVREQ